VEEEVEDDDFESDVDEDDVDEVEDEVFESDDDDFDAGLLLDDEPRLSFR
jgi:hypothetical protein